KISTNGPITRYAYSFAQAGDMENALDMVEKSRKRVFNNLTHYFNQFQNVKTQASSIRAELKQAHTSGDMDKQEKLMARFNNLVTQSKGNNNKLDGAFFNLAFIQRIYYMAGKDKKGDAVAAKVKKIANGMLGFPSNKKESQKLLKGVDF